MPFRIVLCIKISRERKGYQTGKVSFAYMGDTNKLIKVLVSEKASQSANNIMCKLSIE